MDALKTVTSGSRRFWNLYWGKRNRPFRQYLREHIRTLLHPIANRSTRKQASKQ
jgi:hypothetical protein